MQTQQTPALSPEDRALSLKVWHMLENDITDDQLQEAVAAGMFSPPASTGTSSPDTQIACSCSPPRPSP